MQKNIASYLIIILVGVLIYLNFFHQAPQQNNADFLFWGQLNIILHTIPIIIYYHYYSKINAFPFIALLAFFQILTFGLPVFFIRIDSFQLTKSLNIEALQLSFYGFLIFYATYFGLYNHIFQRVKTFQPIPGDANKIFLNITRYLFLLIYILSNFYQIEGIRHLGNFSLYVYLGFTLSLLLKNKIHFIEIFIFFIVVLYELTDRITSGLIALVAILIMYLCLLIMMEGTKKYLIAIILLPFLIFYSLFSGVKGAFRTMTWSGEKTYTNFEKISLITELIQEDKASAAKKDIEGTDNFLWRFSYPMSALSMVLEKTPKDVPFWNGSSYSPIFTKFIPRAFYPSKPEENMGQRFGKTYRVLRQTDNSTSMNTPILAEMYMNFGYNGIYIGMFLFGLMFIFLDKVLNNRKVSKENMIVNMAILFPLIILESNFSLVYGNVILICISLWVLFRIFKFT